MLGSGWCWDGGKNRFRQKKYERFLSVCSHAHPPYTHLQSHFDPLALTLGFVYILNHYICTLSTDFNQISKETHSSSHLLLYITAAITHI